MATAGPVTMTTRIHANYVITKKLNLDLEEMERSCNEMYVLIKEKFSDQKQDYTGQSTLSTQLFAAYNLFLYPYNQFYELFQDVKTVFREHCHDDKKYYIGCWLNVYRAGDFIDWHSHWPPEKHTWHGFYCVRCEPSHTSYRIPGGEEIDITSEDNLLVMSPSDGDTHRSSPWHDAERARITIAFDIVPREHVDPYWLNHWIPM